MRGKGRARGKRRCGERERRREIPESCANLWARVERKRNRGGISHAGSLDDDGIILLLAASKGLERLDEVPAHCAAHAPADHHGMSLVNIRGKISRCIEGSVGR